MAIKGLIFDYGGVLLDMRADLARTIELEHGLAERAIGNTLYTTETWRRLEVGEGTRDAWLLEAHGVLETSAGRTLPPVLQHWFEGQHLIDANIELIGRLRSAYKTAVLSNADHTLMHRLRDVWNIADLFDDIVCSADVGLAKPDPKIYALAAHRLAVTPAECVFVDDLERNVDAAREAGMRAVHFRIDLGHALEEQFAALGVRP